MIDILLAHSNFVALDPKQSARMRPYPPLATLYAASMLRDAGYRIALFDATFASNAADFGEALNIHRPRLVALYEDNFNFLSKMCLHRMRTEALRMLGMARASGARCVAAGSDVTDHPTVYLAHGADLALIGEADHTVVETVALLLGATPGSTVNDLAQTCTLPDGVAWQSSDCVKSTPRRPSERRIDRFPVPAWDLVEVERYRNAWRNAHGYFSVNMATTRGCPYRCNWCAKPIWGQQYAVRSPRAVASELSQLKRTIAPDHIWFADDIFGLKRGWIENFAVEVEALEARVPFMIQSRADLMTADAVTALARAGCSEVWLGAESGSQKILDAMDKDVSIAEIGDARRRLGEAGIRVGFFLQFGYPGETHRDIMLTVQMVRDLLPDEIGVSVSYPLPGTRFHVLVRDQLGAQVNWIDSGDLAMMFQGPYRSPFYRRLHDVLHRDFEYRQLRNRPDLPLKTGDWRHGRQLAELARIVEAEWQELDQLEKLHRNTHPTQLPPVMAAIAAPKPFRRALAAP